MSKNKKGGRPKKSATQKLKHRISYMLPTIEYFALKTRAKNAGISLAEISRRAVMDCEIIPRLTPDESGWIRQLSGMSNNLNQIAHQANIAGYHQVKNEMAELAEEIRTIKNLLKDDGKDKKR